MNYKVEDPAFRDVPVRVPWFKLSQLSKGKGGSLRKFYITQLLTLSTGTLSATFPRLFTLCLTCQALNPDALSPPTPDTPHPVPTILNVQGQKPVLTSFSSQGVIT